MKIGKTALIYAAMYGNLTVVNALIKGHADPNIKDSTGIITFC